MKWYSTKELKIIEQNIHLTDREVAEILGRDRRSVINARQRYKIKKP